MNPSSLEFCNNALCGPQSCVNNLTKPLAVMINGIQHVVIVANDYHYDRCTKKILFEFNLLKCDVFGLDDDGLKEYGADGGIDLDTSQGITAWWQLQHQHNYKPLVTPISFKKEYIIDAI